VIHGASAAYVEMRRTRRLPVFDLTIGVSRLGRVAPGDAVLVSKGARSVMPAMSTKAMTRELVAR
jgi:hypothetical protein